MLRVILSAVKDWWCWSSGCKTTWCRYSTLYTSSTGCQPTSEHCCRLDSTLGSHAAAFRSLDLEL